MKCTSRSKDCRQTEKTGASCCRYEISQRRHFAEVFVVRFFMDLWTPASPEADGSQCTLRDGRSRGSRPRRIPSRADFIRGSSAHKRGGADWRSDASTSIPSPQVLQWRTMRTGPARSGDAQPIVRVFTADGGSQQQVPWHKARQHSAPESWERLRPRPLFAPRFGRSRHSASRFS